MHGSNDRHICPDNVEANDKLEKMVSKSIVEPGRVPTILLKYRGQSEKKVTGMETLNRSRTLNEGKGWILVGGGKGYFLRRIHTP